MAHRLIAFLVLKATELYWTTTRAAGLEILHDGRLHTRINDWLKFGFYPFYLVGAWYCRRADIRFIDARFEGAPYGIVEHVGHCAMDFDAYLKDQILSGRTVRPVFLCADRRVANDELLSHWGRHIRFVRGPWADRLLRPLMSFPQIVDSTEGYSAISHGAARMYDIQARWAGRPPLLALSEAEIARGEAQLRELGIPKGAWFVCVHSREGGYIKVAEWQHAFRNSDIRDYAEAMKAIVARGGWCIRVGDSTMRPADPMPGVVDYAHSSMKSGWMDVFLCARCRFFLGNSSGLFGVASVFGRPSALANMIPLVCAYSAYPNDITAPKLLRRTNGDVMSFPDAFSSEDCNLRYAPVYIERGLSVIDNTADEIAELAKEMLDHVDGRSTPNEDEAELQSRFLSLIRPHHYCWRASSRVGNAFLRRHRALLPNDGCAGHPEAAPPAQK